MRDRRNISTDTDLRLACFFGLSNGYWLRLQNSYDTMEAHRNAGKNIEQIKLYQLKYQEEICA